MEIANIIYEKELVNHTKLDYVNYYNRKIEYGKIDTSLPTLYVGWSFMKECNPDNEIIQNADILNNKIIPNKLYWEYSFDESKSSHIRGIEKFIKFAPQFFFSPQHTYINLDPVFFQISYIEELMDVLPKKIDSLYNYKNEMLYLRLENKIIGVDLNMYEFYRFSKEDIVEKIKDRTKNVHTDVQGDIYQSFYKIFPTFPQLKRYLIVLLSK